METNQSGRAEEHRDKIKFDREFIQNEKITTALVRTMLGPKIGGTFQRCFSPSTIGVTWEKFCPLAIVLADKFPLPPGTTFGKIVEIPENIPSSWRDLPIRENEREDRLRVQPNGNQTHDELARRDERQLLERVCASVKPLIVIIEGRETIATGFAVRTDDCTTNVILTAAHNLKAADAYFACFGDTLSAVRCDPIQIDCELDIAVLKPRIPDHSEWLPIASADTRLLEVGDRLFMAGCPGSAQVRGFEGAVNAARISPSTVVRILSESRVPLNRLSLICHDMFSTPGLSGSPLVDVDGFVRGIHIGISRDAALVGFGVAIEHLQELDLTAAPELGTNVPGPIIDKHFPVLTQHKSDLETGWKIAKESKDGNSRSSMLRMLPLSIAFLFLMATFVMYSFWNIDRRSSTSPVGKVRTPVVKQFDLMIVPTGTGDLLPPCPIFKAPLPLTVGDAIQFKAISSQPTNYYLIWLNSNGELTPIWPWNPRDWTQTPTQTPSNAVSFPEGTTHFELKLDPATEAGIHSVILLTSQDPPLDFTELRRLLDELPSLGPGLSLLQESFVMKLDNGEMLFSPDRSGSVLGELRYSRNPVVALNELIRNTLLEKFDDVKVVSFAYGERQ